MTTRSPGSPYGPGRRGLAATVIGIKLLIGLATLLVLLCELAPQPAGAAETLPAVSAFHAGSLTLYVGSRPLRLALHRDGRPLLAERHHPDRGSLALLDASGWRPAGEVIAIRAEPLPELPADRAGDLPETVSVAPPRGGPGLRIVIEAACRGRAPVAVEVRLARDPDEAGFALSAPGDGVLGVRCDYAAQLDEERLVFARAHPGESPGQVLFSSLGYALLLEAAAQPAAADAATVLAPDPDTFRLGVRGAAFRWRLIPGAPEPALRRLGPGRRVLVPGPASWLWVVAPGARGAAASPPGGESRLEALLAGARLEPPVAISTGDARLTGEAAVSPASWEELRGGVTRALAGALIGEPPAIVLPDAPPAGAADELWLRALAAAAFLPRLALPEELVAAALGDLRRKPAAAGASAARRYLHARAAVAAALRAGDRLDDAGWAQLPFAARPLEAEAWKEDGAWFAGLDLLVAPVLAPDQRGRRVYFPAGRWLDVRDLGPRTGAPPARTGPRREAIEVPAGEVGLFVREGAGEELGRALWKALHGP